ncbi:MAG: RHS repeat-associated core domain-containing protein [Verrucomicrobiota bacterium]|nr:hypothetical protein [Limisphaera sp.]MDW8382750.1 RHS repeat-associated core domain-containing protein [Verrucomicrobiota bacterium]
MVTVVKAADGTVSACYESDPFGQTIHATGPMAKENSFRFSTKRTDETTDLVLYEYRAYSPSLGRWLSRDPWLEEGFAFFGSQESSYPGINRLFEGQDFG